MYKSVFSREEVMFEHKLCSKKNLREKIIELEILSARCPRNLIANFNLKEGKTEFRVSQQSSRNTFLQVGDIISGFIDVVMQRLSQFHFNVVVIILEAGSHVSLFQSNFNFCDRLVLVTTRNNSPQRKIYQQEASHFKRKKNDDRDIEAIVDYV